MTLQIPPKQAARLAALTEKFGGAPEVLAIGILALWTEHQTPTELDADPVGYFIAYREGQKALGQPALQPQREDASCS